MHVKLVKQTNFLSKSVVAYHISSLPCVVSCILLQVTASLQQLNLHANLNALKTAQWKFSEISFLSKANIKKN